jgi:hypothetical protein
MACPYNGRRRLIFGGAEGGIWLCAAGSGLKMTHELKGKRNRARFLLFGPKV